MVFREKKIKKKMDYEYSLWDDFKDACEKDPAVVEDLLNNINLDLIVKKNDLTLVCQFGTFEVHKDISLSMVISEAIVHIEKSARFDKNEYLDGLEQMNHLKKNVLSLLELIRSKNQEIKTLWPN